MPAATIPAPSAACRAAILQSERANRLPDRLLDAISVVESGRRDPVSGAVYAWPWTINAAGTGHFYDTKAEAVAAAKAFQAQGIQSLDVGCAQVNLLHHPDAFTSLDQAFDPVANAAYAGRFLQQLFSQTNAWPLAAAAYHSMTPELGADYARRVLAAWAVPALAVTSQVVTQPAAAGTQPPPAPAAPPPLKMRLAVPGSTPGPLTNRDLAAYRAAPIGLAMRPGRPS